MTDSRVELFHVYRVYRELHKRSASGKHWLWRVVEIVASGEEDERWALDGYGYQPDTVVQALYGQKKENEAKIRALEEALLVSLGKGNATFWTRAKWVFKKPGS